MRHISYLFSAFILLAAGSAQAAPQVLGLIAYNEPVPLTCDGGQCQAELTTICLQKHRDNPGAGAQYTFYGDGQVNLVLTDAEGVKRTVPARDHVRVATARGFTATTVELTERELASLGAVSAELDISGRVSLVPVPEPGDPNPITQRELDYVMSVLRTEADRWLAGSDSKTVAAQVINRIINVAPKRGRLTADARQSLWTDAVGTRAQDLPAKGVERAQDIVGACEYMVDDVGRFFSMRKCLEYNHDSMVLDMNTSYWDAVKPGS